MKRNIPESKTALVIIVRLSVSVISVAIRKDIIRRNKIFTNSERLDQLLYKMQQSGSSVLSNATFNGCQSLYGTNSVCSVVFL